MKISPLILALLVVPALAADPASAVRAALADCRTLPADRQPQARYLSLFHKEVKSLAEWEQVLGFWANSLSQEVELVRPVRVAPGLYRVFLDDYGWKREVWEKLLDAPEPYFHVRALVNEIVTVTEERAEQRWINDYQGRGYWQQIKVPVKKEVAKQVEKVASAPWLDARDIADLIARTQSQVPIVRADWWVFQTGIAAGRKAGYYDWLGLGKKEADFQGLIGADVKLARKLRKESAAIVARSSVTLNNRSMARVPTLTGAYWFTQDYLASADAKNPLRLLDGDAKPDASEQFGSLPNGLFAFWLQDGAGNRQDTAPDTIASDGKSRGTDRRVHAGVSCVRCHLGIHPIDDWARKVYRPPFELDSPDYATRKRLRSLYLSDLAAQIRRDQEDYAAVLKELNGLTPAATGQALADAWDDYAERDRTLEDVAREAGVEPKAFAELLRAEAGAGRKLDPVLAGLLQGAPVRAEHLEEIFPEVMRIRGTS
jgi:hypothetical protein